MLYQFTPGTSIPQITTTYHIPNISTINSLQYILGNNARKRKSMYPAQQRAEALCNHPPSTRGQARMDAAFSHYVIKSTDADCIDKLVDQTSILRFKVDIFKQSKPKHPFNIQHNSDRSLVNVLKHLGILTCGIHPGLL